MAWTRLVAADCRPAILLGPDLPFAGSDIEPVLSSTIVSSSVLFGMNKPTLLAEMVGSSETTGAPVLELPPDALPRNTGAIKARVPDADNLTVCPAAGVPLTVAEKSLEGMVRSM